MCYGFCRMTVEWCKKRDVSQGTNRSYLYSSASCYTSMSPSLHEFKLRSCRSSSFSVDQFDLFSQWETIISYTIVAHCMSYVIIDRFMQLHRALIYAFIETVFSFIHPFGFFDDCIDDDVCPVHEHHFLMLIPQKYHHSPTHSMPDCIHATAFSK